MTAFDEKAIIELLRKSYFAADGLWFLAVENAYSYDEALRLDKEVWRILPKIQARKARELLGIKDGSLSDLALALGLRFSAEGCDHRIIEQTQNVLRIEMHSCPWLDALQRSDRMALAKEICERICVLDYKTWAAQFSSSINFSLGRTMSTGAPSCELVFMLEPSEHSALGRKIAR
ncbi:MAG: DUF6125 family protein [Armatimonadota bacterium]|nr:DUF6125 family protein [Armatimonadota bacterium]